MADPTRPEEQKINLTGPSFGPDLSLWNTYKSGKGFGLSSKWIMERVKQSNKLVSNWTQILPGWFCSIQGLHQRNLECKSQHSPPKRQQQTSKLVSNSLTYIWWGTQLPKGIIYLEALKDKNESPGKSVLLQSFCQLQWLPWSTLKQLQLQCLLRPKWCK